MKLVKMPSGRDVINLFADVAPAQQEATAAATEAQVATAAVSNTTEGVCPKCSRSMGFAMIPTGQVYYCTTCRVSTPMQES